MAVRKLVKDADYATVAALLAADDLPQQEMKVWGMRMLVRALTLEEREQARALALRLNGTLDMLVFYRQCLRYGVLVPPLNDEQAMQLCRKHAGAVQQIADLIYNLSEPSYERVAAIARSMVDLDAPDDADAGESAATRSAA